MYCTNCRGYMKVGDKVCPACGCPVLGETGNIDNKSPMRKAPIIIMLIVVVCILIVGVILIFCSNEKNKKDDESDCDEVSQTIFETIETTTAEELTTRSTTEATTETVDIDESLVNLTMPSENGEKIYIFAPNDELGERINYFREEYPQYSDMVEYVNLGKGAISSDYINEIENAIANGGTQSPSIVALDTDIALQLIKQDSFISMDELGITSTMYSNAYQYTIDYATVEGDLKALTWQATPGGFIYRTDIAEEVLGTSESDEVQEYVKDWDAFLETAGTMKAVGYAMISGTDDLKYAMLDERTSPWVSDDRLSIDSSVIEYLEYARTMYVNGYTANTIMWSADWTNNMDGNVFGYFGCPWFVYWSIFSEDHAGDWHMCQGPADYHWGGTYLGVTDICPNKELAALVLYTICCDTEVMYKLSEETYDFVNNKDSIEQLIADGKGGTPCLGGQNPLVIWNHAAQEISLNNATEYDIEFNSMVVTASDKYNMNELATVDEATQFIKDSVSSVYPYITAN